MEANKLKKSENKNKTAKYTKFLRIIKIIETKIQH